MEADRSLPLIVCFGDSLTAGYQSPTLEAPSIRETPYGAFLQARLGRAARVAVSGVCGEVTAEMVARFGRDVLARRPGWVVVLGGTNDLGGNVALSEILRNLTALYERALAAGVRPVAVTVPSIRMGRMGRADGEPASAVGRSWEEDHIARRERLNRAIADHCAARGLTCVDLFAATLEPGTRRLARGYSNDGLHLTTEGYRRFADLLYERVFREFATSAARRR